MSLSKATDFAEVAHCGGVVTFHVRIDKDGAISYHTSYRSSRPVPATLIEVYALPQGPVVEAVSVVGLGQSMPIPAVPGSILVLIGSDSEGHFGHQCPRCRRYWRGEPWPAVCPYCAAAAPPHRFLSEAQLRYVRHYVQVLDAALGEAGETATDVEVRIDLDAVADATAGAGPKPAFYVAEERQQHQFKCAACNAFNDIIGRYGYCSLCGSRNDGVEFRSEIDLMRSRLTSGAPPGQCVRDAVSAFDALVGRFVEQLVARVPMTKARRAKLMGGRFHDFAFVRETLEACCDIKAGSSMADGDVAFLVMMFHRRHVYEHKGGVVDERYLSDSGDASVRLGQSIRETSENCHRLMSLLNRSAQNIEKGFHEIFPPLQGPIESWNARKPRRARSEDPT